MESGGGGNSSVSDWDRPVTGQELEAIDAAFRSTPTTAPSSSSSSINRQRFPSPSADDRSDGDRPAVRRRLPDSIDRCGSSDSFSLSPCPKNRAFSAYQSPSPAKLMRYPKFSFQGNILYSRTIAEVEKAAKELLKMVETRKKEVDQVILGFDIEWKPTFKKGVPPRKVAVMQICGDTSHCYVMHLIHSGIPQSLRSLLEDPTSVKVGVGVADDASKVFNDCNISIKPVEDLSGLANQKFGQSRKQWGLASLTEFVICKQLPKPKKIKLGNWEAAILSKEQLQYAATDAFASWYLYQSLKTLPDPDAPGNEGKESGNVPQP